MQQCNISVSSYTSKRLITRRIRVMVPLAPFRRRMQFPAFFMPNTSPKCQKQRVVSLISTCCLANFNVLTRSFQRVEFSNLIYTHINMHKKREHPQKDAPFCLKTLLDGYVGKYISVFKIGYFSCGIFVKFSHLIFFCYLCNILLTRKITLGLTKYNS